jgi:hypothetical protein
MPAPQLKKKPLAIVSFSDDPPEEVLERVRRQLEASVKEAANSSISAGASDALPKSMHATIINSNTIVIDSDKTWAKYVDEGTSGSTLFSLIGKIVPLRLRSGVTIFRRVTMEAISRGRWRIPPRSGTNFVQEGMLKAAARDPALTRYGADLDDDVDEIWV